MPELPEVETTKKGLYPHIVGKKASGVTIRNAGLRWPVPADLGEKIRGKVLLGISRRAKYLLFDFAGGHLVIHLGMSGSLRYLGADVAANKHEHVDLCFDDGSLVRLRDPRRFGAVLWIEGAVSEHPLFSHLGIEPLTAEFSGMQLYLASRGKKSAIKQLLMNNRVLVGVGNIYANEALFWAGIDPFRPADSVDAEKYELLALRVKEILLAAINLGGSTLRDFLDSEGNPGYFQQNYGVYGKGGLPCTRCGATILQQKQAGRMSFYCPNCQK